jgi:(2Fe-2S) ferredoxin
MSCSKKKKLLVCTKGKSCPRLDSFDIFDCLKKAIDHTELGEHFKVKKAECFDMCKYGPIVKVEPDGALYGRVGEKECVKIVLRHLKKKKPLKKLLVAKKK